MVRKRLLLQKVTIFFLILMSATHVYADPLLDGPEPPPDTAPLDDYLIFVALFAILFGFYLIKSNQKQTLLKR